MVKRQKTNHRSFFTREEKNQIVSAIREAEKKTSGEIRVFLEKGARGDLMERAQKIFEKLGMTRTKRRNGVLIYLSIRNREFVILGDRGIHQKVGDDFWRDVVSIFEKRFSEGHFVEGIVSGIHEIGKKLQIHFPREKGDVNELPDTV